MNCKSISECSCSCSIKVKEIKMKKITLSVVLAIVLLTSVVSAASAQATRISFTGGEVWVKDISMGKEFFPSEGRYHVREAVSMFALTTTDERVTGDNRVTINWNFKLVDSPVFVTGPMWGTFRIDNDGGYWEGTWTGVRDENGYSYFHYVGKGGGGYEGMMIGMYAERLDPDPTAGESFTGFILNPGEE